MRLCGHGISHATPQRVQKPPRKYTHSLKKENVTQEMIRSRQTEVYPAEIMPPKKAGPTSNCVISVILSQSVIEEGNVVNSNFINDKLIPGSEYIYFLPQDLVREASLPSVPPGLP